MNIEFTKSYRKSFNKLKDLKTREAIATAAKSVMKAEDQRQILNLRKLVGFKNDYRIKIGKYRIGIRIENDTVYFVIVAHRKDFYKFFPK